MKSRSRTKIDFTHAEWSAVMIYATPIGNDASAPMPVRALIVAMDMIRVMSDARSSLWCEDLIGSGGAGRLLCPMDAVLLLLLMLCCVMLLPNRRRSRCKIYHSPCGTYLEEGSAVPTSLAHGTSHRPQTTRVAWHITIACGVMRCEGRSEWRTERHRRAPVSPTRSVVSILLTPSRQQQRTAVTRSTATCCRHGAAHMLRAIP